MKRLAFAALLLIVPLAAFAASAPTQAVIVMTKAGGHLAVKSLSASFDPTISDDARDVREFTAIHGFAANLTADEIASLKASGEVVSIEPDLERHALTDTITAGQQTTPYGVTDIDAPPVWPVTRGKSLAGGPAIHIAIIDTGIDYNNPELSGVFKSGFNYIARTTDPLDDNGHGTHVAGTIAAANDGAGVVGIASDVDVYSLKVLDTCGSGRTSDIIQAVDFVVQKKKAIGGNWIINLSLGADLPVTAEQAEYQAASDAGILVFAAAGNGFDGTTLGLSYPAGYPTVISVGAVDSTNTIADFSQRGPDLKLVAPGVDVLSTFVAPMVGTNDGRKIAATRADYRDATTMAELTFSACPPATTGITGTFVSCGFGAATDFPSAVHGKIALVQRGPLGANGIPFFDKAQNAFKAGATAIIVYDNAPVDPANPIFPGFFTTATSAATIPATAPFLMITQADGQALLATPNVTVSLTSGFEEFALLAGTSMACPHAVGAAALVWASSPNSTASNVSTALEQTAKDLGDPGQDNTYGFGLVDAFAAARMLNPSAFATGPATGPVHSRFAGRRGH